MSEAVKFNWPPTRFALENTPGGQLDHVLSEALEVSEALDNPSKSAADVEEELADLHHSIETYWRILQTYYGSDHVAAIMARVEVKNRVRGYYETGA
jgi:NTP pyrophosphatase (non-canonical NTP hydrolase)